ncbi:hypothetical protein [Ralstonia sp. 24A2]|uniref:hypothetical protein n=1 Tax=Ralstonia sp. 24A2 TaxID=3447364 RepID=UPI003F69DC73
MIAFILLALLTLPVARLIGTRENVAKRWLWFLIAAIQVYVVVAIGLRDAGGLLREWALFGSASSGSGLGWLLALSMSVVTIAMLQMRRRATHPFSAAVLCLQLAVSALAFYQATALAGIQAFWVAPLLVFILRKMDFGRRWRDLTGKVDETHYASSFLELSYTPGSDTFDIVFKQGRRGPLASGVKLLSLPSSEQGVWKDAYLDEERAKLQNEHAQPVKLPFAAQGLPLVHELWSAYMGDANSCFGDPCLNLLIRSKEEETLYTPTSTQTTYVPGSTATGWTNNGQMINVDIPGKTITTQVQSGPATWAPSGYCTVTIEANLNDVCYSYTMTAVPKKEANLIVSVGQAINKKAWATIHAMQRAEKAQHEAAAQKRRAAEQAAVEAASTKAAESVRQVLEAAGFHASGEGVFSWHRHDPSGVLVELIAADRNGRAFVVAGQGADRWQGLWQGAEAKLEGNALQLKVVDEAYRAQHLAERRFSLMTNVGLNEQQAWCDRVNLLGAAKA